MRQLPGREIVEKEQRLGTLHEDVVDAMIDEIDADRIVLVGEKCDLQLGADAVGTRDQHGVLVSPALELKQTTERTDVGQHARGKSRAGKATNTADGFVARVDIYSGRLVVHQPMTGSRSRSTIEIGWGSALTGSGFSFSASCR